MLNVKLNATKGIAVLEPDGKLSEEDLSLPPVLLIHIWKKQAN